MIELIYSPDGVWGSLSGTTDGIFYREVTASVSDNTPCLVYGGRSLRCPLKDCVKRNSGATWQNNNVLSNNVQH